MHRSLQRRRPISETQPVQHVEESRAHFPMAEPLAPVAAKADEAEQRSVDRPEMQRAQRSYTVLYPGSPPPPTDGPVTIQASPPDFRYSHALPMQDTGDLAAKLRAELGKGAPLGPSVQRQLEARLGASLSQVRVHTDTTADALARSVQAVAFTTESDIFFRQGAYKPDTPGGLHLLAHEATHTIQQSEGAVDGTPHPGGVSISDPGDRFERAADEAARSVSRGDLTGMPAVQRHPKPRDRAAVKPASGTRRSLEIQRKVGFEFEGSYWRPFIDQGAAGVRRANRKEMLHQGTGFKLEADDSLVTPDKPNEGTIEFVTDPYDLDKQGLKDLKTSLKEIKAIMKRIRRHADANPAQQFATGNFVMPNQHQLSNANVRLAGGSTIAPGSEMFKMQATQGVSLEDLRRLMKLIGTDVPGGPATSSQLKMRRLIYGQDPATSLTRLIGGVPALAATAVDYIKNNRAALGFTLADETYFEGTDERLLGFFSRILLYVKSFTIGGAGVLKYKIPLLGRIDFGTLFQQLDQGHRKLLAKNNARALIEAMVHAANSQSFLPKQAHLGGGFLDAGFTANSPLLPNAFLKLPNAGGHLVHTKVMQTLTIEEWLKGIVQNHDYLTPAEMDAWLQANEVALTAPERNQRTELLESFNTIGNQTDPADRSGTSRLDVLESRAISPNTTAPGADAGKLTAAQMADLAVAYFGVLLQTVKKGKD